MLVVVLLSGGLQTVNALLLPNMKAIKAVAVIKKCLY